ncbi:Sensor histidine kinase RcsC [bioreactor metagenome]|uniref:Sensor histidine kinase RcsC n=1 Tax=bioreactor metagenome TaxID=1076179 RepID=A0A645B7Z1_9ZZZZ
MSHEIRTPLNAIIGFNDLLKHSLLNQEQEKHVDIVRIASQNLMVILNDILDVSKLESGQLVLENQPICIKEIIDNVINLQSQKAKNKGLKLLLSIDQDIPLNVIGDSTRISQVLINLIDNAIKFTTEGYVELKVIELARKNGISLLRFNIKDTGIGIDKEKQKMIFDRFSQAESSTTRIFGGTGLGLNIAKMIVEMYGGKIELQSELGKGAEFYFEISLPISNSIEVSSTLETKTVNSNASLAGKSILVVEDNELNKMLASSYLKKNGAIVDLADNGAIALEKVKQKNYDIILMDLQMPVMDGYTATKIIRQELKSELPIVACSAHSSTVENDNCIKMGMNGYISKPYSENTLISVLSSFFIEKSNTKKELINSKITINFDQDDFNKILGNIAIEHGKEFVEMMLEVYLRRIPQDIIEMEQALKNQDREVIRSKAHLLAGSLSSLNFEVGTKLAKNVENSVFSKDFETINLKTISLIDYLKKSIKEIKQ